MINTLLVEITPELYTLIAVSFCVLIVVILFFWIWRLEKRIKKILGSGTGKDIEAAIVENHRKIIGLEKSAKLISEENRAINAKLKKSIRSIETVRFNPFRGAEVGGNQSFSSAFLNEDGDGLILSGLYLRDRVSVYAKPLKNLQTEFELTDEEKTAVEKAKNSIKG